MVPERANTSQVRKVSYFPDTRGGGPLYLNGKPVGRRGGPLPDQWYSTDLWTDFGLKFVDEAREAKKPFFLYMAYNAPHFPLQAPAADIARWRGKYKIGWDKLRQARYERQIKLGLIDKSWPLSPRLPEVPAWDSLTAAQQDRYDNIMAIYAAVVEHMDAAVGHLVAGLKQRGALDNTLILFMSDNGGNAESGVPGRLEGLNPGDAESTVFVGQCWATLNNTPFVRYKHYTDEGGIATLLIAHWPQGIGKARDGRLETQPGHLIDIMPTCLDAAGASYPRTYGGHAITPLEGVSLRPAFSGKKLGRTQPIFWEHESNRAVLDGPWKLVALAGMPWRLYDTLADRTEQHDLATAQPVRVRTLAGEWDAYAARANVLPLGGWRARNANRREAASKATRFKLKAGDHLARYASPDVGKRSFGITVRFDAKPGGGVLVAQGGNNFGYTLFADSSNKLTFLFRSGKRVAEISTDHSVLGKHGAGARLEADGTLTLVVDSEPIIRGRASGPLETTPIDGLDVGSDRGALVGPYGAENGWHGTIDSVIITVDLPWDD